MLRTAPGPRMNSGRSPHTSVAMGLKVIRLPGADDPLGNLTQWQIYQDCIWISDEDTNTKIMLLCITRFMDKKLRGSSMS